MTNEFGLLLVVASAFMLGSNKLAVRLSLFNMDESIASTIAILLALPIFGIPLLIYGWNPRAIAFNAILMFVVAGVLNYALGRYFVWKSIGRIGANRGNIMASMQTIYAVAIAVLFLNQSIDLISGFGISLVILGIFFVSYRGSEGTIFTTSDLRRGIIYGAIGGFLWGISQVLMQIGIAQYSNALAASFLTFVAGLIGSIPVLFMTHRYAHSTKVFFPNSRFGFMMIIIAGLLGNFGLYFRYVSLELIPLTIVSTINGTNPIITLLLSSFLLREAEGIDARTILGIISSVTGVLLISH